MLRRALVVAAFASLALGCGKDSKHPAPAAGGDSRVAVKDPVVTDGSAEGSGPVKASADAAAPGSGTADVPGSGSSKGTDKVVKGSGTADPKGATQTLDSDPAFSMTITSPDAVAAGSSATAKLTVKPGKGYHMNEEFPTNLKLEAAAGCTLAKTELGVDDATAFDKDHLEFDVACTPASAGTYTVSGKLKFAVCTNTTCDPKRQAISFAVAAK
jgi:hypothetical protein